MISTMVNYILLRLSTVTFNFLHITILFTSTNYAYVLLCCIAIDIPSVGELLPNP